MQLDTYWHRFIAQMGNEPGEQAGDVVIYLAGPVDGKSSLTVPSSAVSAAAEAGVLLGFAVTQPDGSRAFFPVSSVLGIVDAPEPEGRKAQRK